MTTTRDLSLEELRERAQVKISYHAARQMWSRHIDEREVLLTVMAPRRRGLNSPGHPVDRLVYCNGHIRVIVADRTRVVVTVEPDGVHDYDPDIYRRAARPAGPERLMRLPGRLGDKRAA